MGEDWLYPMVTRTGFPLEMVKGEPVSGTLFPVLIVTLSKGAWFLEWISKYNDLPM